MKFLYVFISFWSVISGAEGGGEVYLVDCTSVVVMKRHGDEVSFAYGQWWKFWTAARGDEVLDCW